MRRYSGPKDRLDAAQNPSTNPTELAALATSEYSFVREAVAANPNTPSPILAALIPETLKTEDDFMIAAGLLRNRRLTVQLCEVLIEKMALAAEGISPRTFYGTLAFERLFEHPAAPLPSLRALLSDASCPKHLRARIAMSQTKREILECLLSDGSERVRQRARQALLSQQRISDPARDLS